MIAHVAEASEDRGRIVVRLGDFASSSPAAILAAIAVAKAFGSELEGLFIENPELYAACTHDVVREIGLSGSRSTLLTAARLAHDSEHFAIAVQRELAEAALVAGVRFKARVVRDEIIQALQRACEQSGPWNIIVFADPVIGDEKSARLTAAVAEVAGTTGYIVCGSGAVWRRGPMVIAIEEIEHLPGMVRCARKLASVTRDPIWVLPVGDDDMALDWLVGEIALGLRDMSLGDDPEITLLPRPDHVGSSLVLRSQIAQTAPRIVIARHGGMVVPVADTSSALAALTCPVFLVHAPAQTMNFS